jgi:chromosome segregation ATPase
LTEKINEIESYNEQIRQHSLTIINFEKEIEILRAKELEYKGKIIQLEKNVKDAEASRKIVLPPQPVIVQTDEKELASLNRTVEALRAECQTYKSRISEQDELIRTLRRDLSGASAKLSDVQGELTEKQKRELERNKQLVIEQQRELSDNRGQMAKLSEIVDKQTKQLETLKIELT